MYKNINMNNINTSTNNGGNTQFKNKVKHAINSITNSKKKDEFNRLLNKMFTDKRKK